MSLASRAVPLAAVATVAFTLSFAACSSRAEPQGVLPNAQRAGEVARESRVAKAFLQLYPDAVPEAASDRCADEIGEGRACDGPEHYDVTFTHTDRGTPPRVTKLAIEVGRGEAVMGSVPSALLVYEEQSCIEDSDCICAPCSGCFNRVHAPAKTNAEAAGCNTALCQSAGCGCRSGKCRTGRP
jgi:hypothetical protein